MRLKSWGLPIYLTLYSTIDTIVSKIHHFASLRMSKLHCLTSMLGLCGSPHKTNQQTQTFTKESVVFSLHSWGSQTSNFLFLALSGLKRSWLGPIIQMEFNGVVRSSNDGNFAAVFRVHPCFLEYVGQTPPVCGWKVMISIGPNQ